MRIYDTSSNEMVYELSVYWHHKEGDTGENSYGGKTKDKDKEGGNCESGSAPMEFSISGPSGVYYRSKALMRLKDLLPTIDEAISVAVINERVIASE